MYASRLPPQLSPNAFALALAELRTAGTPLLDLTETNPTRVGLAYPHDVLGALADPAALTYQPDAAGLASARVAIAADYARRGVAIDPDRLVLTASTSEGYALLFKLLCDAGDDVLVPQPSYPLFELLTALEHVRARPYHLDYHGVWSIDRDSVARAITPRTRAMLIVSPNNPTGSMLRAGDRDWLVSLAAERGIAVIADEVFADYPLARRSDATAIAGESRVLTFALGGLSKSAGLPQVKLGWIAVSGPATQAREAIERLVIINDTYLSASTPVQVAAPRLIAAGAQIRRAIADRLAMNLATLRARVADSPAVTLIEPEGGWSAVLAVPAIAPEETLVLSLLREQHVVVYPGYFFDFAREAWLVVSLLPQPVVFDDALRRLLPVAAGACA